MTPLLWALTGAAALLALSVLVGCAVDADVRAGLVRVALAAVTVPVLLLTALGMRLPKLTRRRVTRDSLLAALEDGTYRQRTTAVNWPGGALVLLQTLPGCGAPGCTVRRRHRHDPIAVTRS